MSKKNKSTKAQPGVTKGISPRGNFTAGLRIDENAVRNSRDGDFFHYHWAARKCLQLLSPTTDLVAVAIEGSSPSERNQELLDGETVIDVSEYFTSEEIAKATKIHYYQLKHSTKQLDTHWTLSGLQRTLTGFADRFKQHLTCLDADKVKHTFTFQFITNRSISTKITDTVEDLSKGSKPRYKDIARKIRIACNLSESELSDFCQILKLEGNHPCYLQQRLHLQRETYSYLPGPDTEAPKSLFDMVSLKATSINQSDPCVRKMDVLEALNVSPKDLQPAANLIEIPESVLVREQGTEIATLIESTNLPVIVHASGGVGKSILSKQLASHFGESSVVIVYDCYGNGDYRRKFWERHRSSTAFVQISNELSARGLCDPLIPSTRSDNYAYLKAFHSRLEQTISSLKNAARSSQVVIIIDAADSAEIAAREAGEISFARDLIRHTAPCGAKLVFLCRSERRELLDPPPNLVQVELMPFSPLESEIHLRHHYPNATTHDVNEFHILSGGNPRVQSNYLEGNKTLTDTLKAFGSSKLSIDDAIESQLNGSFEKLRDEAFDRTQLDLICTGLAYLRPLVPIDILAKLSGASVSTIRSFSADFGRSLLIREGTIQFRDEPVETWFRKRFKASNAQTDTFIKELKSLAKESTYAALSLPFLLLEGGQFAELIDMALDGKHLPHQTPIEKREIEIQRLQFALKASLREREYLAAAKIAFKAGCEMSGNSREKELIQQNTDLVGALFDQHLVNEIAHSRQFSSTWLGSEHAYESCLLSFTTLYKEDARNLSRLAWDWLRQHEFSINTSGRKAEVSNADIAELLIADLNLHGSSKCANRLNVKAYATSFSVGRIIAKRLIDHDRIAELIDFVTQASKNLHLGLAIVLELSRANIRLPEVQVGILLLALKSSKLKVADSYLHSPLLHAITILIESANCFSLDSKPKLARLLGRYIPKEPPRLFTSTFNNNRNSLLHAYTLHAMLLQKPLLLQDVAYPEIRSDLVSASRYSSKPDVRNFLEEIGPLLYWYRVLLNTTSRTTSTQLSSEIDAALSETKKYDSDGTDQFITTQNDIAVLWFSAISQFEDSDGLLLDRFKTWYSRLRVQLSLTTLCDLGRLAAHSRFHKQCTSMFCKQVLDRAGKEDSDIDTTLRVLVKCARALLPIDKPESKEYLEHAIKLATRVGNEVHIKWSGLLELAASTEKHTMQPFQTFQKFSIHAEMTKQYLDESFDWERTIKALVSIDPNLALLNISRWRERRLVSTRTVVPVLITALLEKNYITGPEALSFLPMIGNWNIYKLLDLSFKNEDATKSKAEMLSNCIRYIQLQKPYVFDWKKLKPILERNNIDLLSLGIDESCTGEVDSKQDRNGKKCLNQVFEGLDICSADGIKESKARLLESKSYSAVKEYWQECIKLVPVEKQHLFLTLLSSVSRLELYDLKCLIEVLPHNWLDKLSTKRALSDLIVNCAKESCLTIAGESRYWEFNLTNAKQFILPDVNLETTILNQLANYNSLFEATRLFSMIEILARVLSPNQAFEALEYCLNSINADIEHFAVGAPLEQISQLRNDTTDSLAYLVWIGLGDPESSIRWQFAHVVKTLGTMNQTKILDCIFSISTLTRPNHFAEPTYHFYHLHSKLYLLIACASISVQAPAGLVHLYEQNKLEIDPSRHILINHFVAFITNELLKRNLISITDSKRLELQQICKSQFPLKPKDYFSPSNMRTKSTEEPYFHMDLIDYWFSPLADCFGLHKSWVESEVAKIILEEWKIKGTRLWEMDKRDELFNPNDTSYFQGTFPKAEDLTFYLSYHALMLVAGKLLETMPCLADDETSLKNSFEAWLVDQLPTRDDGLWLFDQVDVSPIEPRSWEKNELSEHWRWNVNQSDFLEVFIAEGEFFNLWGKWKIINGRNEESIQVRSALVTRSRSKALIGAIEFSDNPLAFSLPSIGDREDIDSGGYKLKAWIHDASRSEQLDTFDPWSGKIPYPPLRPSEEVIEQLALNEKVKGRKWFTQDAEESPLIISEVWGDFSTSDWPSEHGRKLKATQGFITKLTETFDMDLIVQINIVRRKLYREYERHNEETKREIQYVDPYRRCLLLRSGESIKEL